MHARQVPQSYVPSLPLHVAKINLEFAILLPRLPKELELQVCATMSIQRMFFIKVSPIAVSVPSKCPTVSGPGSNSEKAR